MSIHLVTSTRPGIGKRKATDGEPKSSKWVGMEERRRGRLPGVSCQPVTRCNSLQRDGKIQCTLACITP